MDSQNRLTVITKTKDNINYFDIYIDKTIRENVLFEIKEYNTVSIVNHSFDYDILCEDIDNEKDILLRNGEEFEINNFDHPHPVMDYRIKIIHKETKKERNFIYKIRHSNSTSDSQYKQMVSTIEKLDESLLYEDEVKYIKGKRVRKTLYKSLYVLFENLNRFKSNILYCLNCIEKNPDHNEIKEIEKTKVMGKQSARTIVKNFKNTNRDFFYSTKIRVDYNTSLTRYLLYMLNFCKKQLNILSDDCKSEIEKLKCKKEKILRNCSVFEEKRKAHTNYALEQIEKKLKICSDFLITGKELCAEVSSFLNKDYFKNIKPSFSRSEKIIFKSEYLNLEKHLFLNLYQGYIYSIANNYSTILAAPIKQTSKLFEAYCLSIFASIFNDLGYEQVLLEIDNDKVKTMFVRDEYSVEIYYSFDAVDIRYAKSDNFYYLNNNMNNISPDFFLVFKENDTPVKFLVVDSKCKRTHFLNNDIEIHNYDKTIRNYLSFRYSWSDSVFKDSITVDSLWFLLPEDRQKNEYQPLYNLEYKFVELKIDGEEDDFMVLLDFFISNAFDKK